MERRTKLKNKTGRVEKCRKKKNECSLYCRSRNGEQKGKWMETFGFTFEIRKN